MSEIHFDQSARLKTMAKQIADFFRVYPEEQAAARIAEHINKFWTRRMRDEFLALPDLRDAGCDPLLARAAVHIKPGTNAGKS